MITNILGIFIFDCKNLKDKIKRGDGWCLVRSVC
jgi:hypothetical protein